jgi:Fur family ferric uptake transcriptional regulator
MQEKLEPILQQLRAEQFKITPQRKAMLRVLLEHPESHLSAEEIYMFVKQKFPAMGLATVYRTLELLTGLRILEKLDFGDGVARYELRSADAPHHYHLICLQCGSLQEIRTLMRGLEEIVEREHQFRIVEQRVSFFGYCRECRT